MDNYSKKVATAMCQKLIKEADTLRSKEKLTKEELKALRRLREMVNLVRAAGV